VQLEQTQIPGLIVIRPRTFEDDRGLFLETWQSTRFGDAGLDAVFVQDNFSHSRQHVLRGLHYQVDRPQGKLVHVTRGAIFDVAVDLRRSSPAFGKHVGIQLDAVEHTMLYVPPGCAHGFLALSETVDLCYKCTEHYAPALERTLLWNDTALGIDWPLLDGEPLLSEKDARGLPLAESEVYD